ncbi:MAG TPA: hypothetical protein DIV79_03495, partial [Opitutae bacterium]|nr:hypothetical protein [Opitutae bacterium]
MYLNSKYKYFLSALGKYLEACLIAVFGREDRPGPPNEEIGGSSRSSLPLGMPWGSLLYLLLTAGALGAGPNIVMVITDDQGYGD